MRASLRASLRTSYCYYRIVILHNKIKIKIHTKSKSIQNLLCFDDIVELEIGKFMYSIENKTLDTTFLEMFQKTNKRHTRCTRQASRNDFVPPKTRLSTTKRTIIYTGAITWNRIPSEIKNSKSKATFCKAFSKYLREKY